MARGLRAYFRARTLPSQWSLFSLSGTAANLNRTYYVPPSSSGTWQEISVSSYSYYPPRDASGNPTYTVNSPSAISAPFTDAGAAVTLTAIPFREFSKPSPNDSGYIYYHGGLHSGYPGNDIIKIALGTTLTAQQLARPHVPPANDPGYTTSSTASLYKNYTPTLTIANRDQWQPYTYHNYCKNTWHPRLGYLLTNYYPVSWDVNDFPVSSFNTYGNGDGRTYGTIKYTESTNKYTLQSAAPSTIPVLQDLSDYCPVFDGILGLCQHFESYYLFGELSGRTSDAWNFSTYGRTVTANATTGSGSQNNGAAGTVIKHLEGWKFLLLHSVYTDASKQRMWTYSHYSGTVTAVSVPLPAVAGGNFNIAVDKAGQRVFCLVNGNPVRLFRCYFSSLGTWTELTTTSAPSTTLLTENHGRERLFYWNNALYLFDFHSSEEGASHYYRVSLGSQHPSITFARTATTHTTSSGTSISKSKHTNLACCSTDGKVYVHGGDMDNAGSSSGSYSTEINRYDPATGMWDRPQDRAKSGDADQGNLSRPRPYLPDDGGWYWDASSARFWWLPGGGQLVQPEQRAPDMPSQSQIDALIATYGLTRRVQLEFNNISRWKVYTPMAYDPSSNTWEVKTFTPVDNGVLPTYNPDDTSSTRLYWMSAFGGSSGRGNAYDPLTRRMFRFTEYGHMFVFDMASLLVTPYAAMLATDGSSLAPHLERSIMNAHQAIVAYGGKLYHVDIDTMRLIRWNIDQAAIGTGTSKRFPAEVLANDVPTRISGDPLTYENPYCADHSYLRVWNGGLLLWSTNPASLDGDVRMAYWRSLTSVETSDWIPIQFPFDFIANSCSTNTLNDGSYMAMGAYVDTSSEVPHVNPAAFWRIS